MKDTWYWKNRDAIRAKQAAVYKANPEPAKERARQWRKNNPQLAKERQQLYKSTRRKELAAKQKAYYWANHERELIKFAERRKLKRNEQRAFARNKTATLSDQYIREQLAKYSPLSMKDFPQELVETKRVFMQIKRITHPRKAA